MVDFKSTRSLLDADIIIYEPTLSGYWSSSTFQGKTKYNENDSFKIREHLAHWHSELLDAVRAGKMIIVFVAEPEEFLIDTGERRYSGTGRNQRVTEIVAPDTTYSAIPVRLKLRARSGTNVTPAADLKYLEAYWAEFGDASGYEATIQIDDGEFTDVLLSTSSGGAIVGAALRQGDGAIVFLPPLRFDDEGMTTIDDDGDEIWSPDAVARGHRLVAAVSAMAGAIRRGSELTPPPAWSEQDEFVLPRERTLRAEIRGQSELIESARSKRSELELDLVAAGQLRALLYEQGKGLENTVNTALRLMGFDAAPFIDEESEFDSIFLSGEGRFLGEIEGRNTRSINIDKLSQLERNIQEDFAKDEIDNYAKGVLFGNGHRLTEIENRPDTFTAKCISGAERSGIALVRTSDLFAPARYLSENPDPEYATRCREAIAGTSGAIVDFPEPPTSVETDQVDSED